MILNDSSPRISERSASRSSWSASSAFRGSVLPAMSATDKAADLAVAPSSACRPTTSARTSSRWCGRSARCSTRRETRVLVIDDGSPGRHGRDRRPARRGAAVGLRPPPGAQGGDRAGVRRRVPARARGGRRARPRDGLRLLPRPGDVPRLIAAAEDADLVLGSRYVAGGGTENWGLLRRVVSRGGCLYARVILGVRRARPDRWLQVLPPHRARGDRPRRGVRARLRLPDRDDVPRAAGRAAGAGGADPLRRPPGRRVEDDGLDRRRGRLEVPLLRARALTGRL